MAVNFGSLTGEALAAPGSNVGGKTGPDVAGGEKTTGGAGAGVGRIVNVVKKWVMKVGGNERAKNSSGDISMKREVFDSDGGGTKGGGLEQLGEVR